MIRRTGIGYYLIISILLISLCSSSSVHAMRRHFCELNRLPGKNGYPIGKRQKIEDEPLIFKLPDEILLYIFSYATPEEKEKWGLVCHYIRRLILDRELLERIECTLDPDKLEKIIGVKDISLAIIPKRIEALRLYSRPEDQISNSTLGRILCFSFLRVLDLSGDKERIAEEEPDVTNLYPDSHFIYPSGYGYPWRRAESGITDEGLEHIGKLEYLEVLCLGNANISDKGVESLGWLPKLVVLSLFNTGVGNGRLYSLGNLKHLKVLSLAYTDLDDTCLEAVGKLQELRFLDLRGTSITDSAPQFLGDIEKLEAVDLSNTPITDKGLEHLKDADKRQRITRGQGFRVLVFNNTRVSNTGLSLIEFFKDLIVLQLAGTKISDAGLQCMGDLSSLTALTLNENDTLRCGGFIPTHRFKNLRSLFLIETGPDDVGLRAIGEFTNLTILNLNNAIVNDVTCFAFLHHLVNLEELYLPCATPARPLDLCHLKNLLRLKVLDIDYTHVSPSLEGLRGLTKLEVLRARRTIFSTEITDISPLLNHTNLEYFGIFNDEVMDDVLLYTLGDLQEIYQRILSGKEESGDNEAYTELENIKKEVGTIEDEVLGGTLLNLIDHMMSYKFGALMVRLHNDNMEINLEVLQEKFLNYFNSLCNY